MEDYEIIDQDWKEVYLNLPVTPVFEHRGVYYALGQDNPKPRLEHVALNNSCLRACWTCQHRVAKYGSWHGPEGALLAYQQPLDDLKTLHAYLSQFNRCNTFHLITADSAPCIEKGGFCHLSFKPQAVTEGKVLTKFESLRQDWHTLDFRLTQLLTPEARASVAIMAEEQKKLARPRHYSSCLHWIQNLQKFMQDRIGTEASFGTLSFGTQILVKLEAIMTGRVVEGVHRDYRQCDNLIDFMSCAGREALRTEMDRRSDPRNYHVSQLNRALEEHKVTSDHTISLVWDGQYTDDLDLHVTTPRGIHIYFANTKDDGCRLDFDCNYQKIEAQPAENISVPAGGPYQIEVNNYKRRTFGQDIPFTIVLRSKGQPEKVHHGVWGRDRRKGQRIKMPSHTFLPVNPAALTMSKTGIRRAKAHNPEWEAKFGTLTCVIPTLAEIPPEWLTLLNVKTKPEPAFSSTLNQAFMNFTVADGEEKKRKLLHEYEAATLTSLDPEHLVTVNLRNFRPGYITRIQGSGDLKLDVWSGCQWERKFELPVKPTKIENRITTARYPALTRVPVLAVLRLPHLPPFLVFQTTLPSTTEYPRAGGFYFDNLPSGYHVHRERWGFHHSQLPPTIPTNIQSPLLIGAFVLDQFTLTVNGRDQTFKV